MRRAWTDEEDALVLDDALSLAEVAESTGRSIDAVKCRRKRLRRPGGVSDSRAWTEAEDEFIRETPHLTAAQVALRLPGRSRSGVRTRRQQLGVPVSDYSTRNKDPHRRGGRTMVARTCTACGELLDASMFQKVTVERADGTGRPQWDSACSPCQYLSKLAGRPEKQERLEEVRRMRQSESLATASRSGAEWTEDELAKIADLSRPAHEAAREIGRSYLSVLSARSVYGLARRRKFKDDLRWVIEIPGGAPARPDRALSPPTRYEDEW